MKTGLSYYLGVGALIVTILGSIVGSTLWTAQKTGDRYRKGDDAWTPFDALVGHYRRYDPEDLQTLIDTHDLDIHSSAPYGMQPKSHLLRKLSTWFLRRHYETAMFFHNRFFFPLGLKMQKKLLFKPGLTCDDNIDEVLVMCRRRPRV